MKTPYTKASFWQCALQVTLVGFFQYRRRTYGLGPEFEANRQRFQPVLQEQEKKIDKTVDLFSRIKDTEQAEEVVTVLYTARELKKTKKPEEVSERDVSDFILEWKKSWRTDQKSRSIAETIQNLEMLNWLRLKQSEEFSEPQTTP